MTSALANSLSFPSQIRVEPQNRSAAARATAGISLGVTARRLAAGAVLALIFLTGFAAGAIVGVEAEHAVIEAEHALW